MRSGHGCKGWSPGLPAPSVRSENVSRSGKERTRSEQDADALYGLPLEDFTKARNELAEDLRAQGARPAANRVKALPKPTTAAWAVNQVMRTQHKDARALLAAGGGPRAGGARRGA